MENDYIELYKKYRPKIWSEVIGQEVVVSSLKNAVKNNAIPTAYLFIGTAGTGKTTMAKILAKSLNCENVSSEGDPCNKCNTCIAIDEDRQMGVKYLSLANNGSAEDVRRIMTESRLAQPIKKQVWILDEVQNLSSAAQDALLIGLESDSQKSLFIFCTTDPEKIKPAVISRVQERVLNKVDVKTLAQHLVKIARAENLVEKVSKDDIIKSAQIAKGSVRNAVSNLETITTGGKLSSSYSNKLISAITTGNPVEIYKITSKMAEENQNFTKTIEVLYTDFSYLLRNKSGDTIELGPLQEFTNKLSGSFILQALKEIGDTITRITNRVVDSKIIFEMCLVKLTLIYKKQNK